MLRRVVKNGLGRWRVHGQRYVHTKIDDEAKKGMDPYVRDIGHYIVAAGVLLFGTAVYKNMNDDDSLVCEYE